MYQIPSIPPSAPSNTRRALPEPAVPNMNTAQVSRPEISGEQFGARVADKPLRELLVLSYEAATRLPAEEGITVYQRQVAILRFASKERSERSMVDCQTIGMLNAGVDVWAGQSSQGMYGSTVSMVAANKCARDFLDTANRRVLDDLATLCATKLDRKSASYRGQLAVVVSAIDDPSTVHSLRTFGNTEAYVFTRWGARGDRDVALAIGDCAPMVEHLTSEEGFEQWLANGVVQTGSEALVSKFKDLTSALA